MFLKNIVRCTIIIMALAIVVSSAGCENVTKGQSAKVNENIREIQIDFDNDYLIENNSICIKDKKIINDIVSMIHQSRSTIKDDELDNIPKKYNKMTIHKVDGDKKEIFFSYDTVYQKGFIKIGDRILIPQYDFFRYMEDLAVYTELDTNVDEDIINLFKKYDWTVDYKINTIDERLPESFKHSAGEYPTKIYWAYNNEFSKAISMDFSKYLGKTVDVEIYRLREPLPDNLSPMLNARGIVLKSKDKIIGAYIDSGKHNLLACSLDRRSLEDITEKNWDEWVKKYIDYNDKLESKLSKMEPKDIIKEFFDAINHQDKQRAFACLTRKELCKLLSTNLDNHNLYNSLDNYTSLFNMKRVELKDIQREENVENDPHLLEYQIAMYIDFEEPIVEEDGLTTRFILLKKCSAKNGWRIDGICTGP